MNNNIRCYSITVIITIYNASQYLRQCIDNILSQNFQDFELLLVNDGSTDSTGEICDEYAKKDKRIKVFHEQHKGVAHARQVGLDNAKGEYILYIDADDIIEPTMLVELYNTAKTTDAELVICDYTELTNSGTVYRKQEPTSKTGIGVLEDILNGILYGALWNKLIKTDCIRKSQAMFPFDLTMREDLLFLAQVLPTIYNVQYMPKSLYGYERRNTSSLTNNYANESTQYYRQELLWNRYIIDNQGVSLSIRNKRLQYYHELAYITLRSDLLSKEDWKTFFVPYAQRLKLVGTGYKKALVLLALNGHFTIARIIRTIISKIK